VLKLSCQPIIEWYLIRLIAKILPKWFLLDLALFLFGQSPRSSEEGTTWKVLRTFALRPRPESSLDCLICAIFALQGIRAPSLSDYEPHQSLRHPFWDFPSKPETSSATMHPQTPAQILNTTLHLRIWHM